MIHTSAASDDWETWCNQSQIDISSARGLIVSSAQVAFQAARDGLGVAIGRLPLIDNDIAAGRLAVAVDHVVPVMSAYWLVKPPGNETPREIVAFRNWLLDEMYAAEMERQQRDEASLETRVSHLFSNGDRPARSSAPSHACHDATRENYLLPLPW